MDILNLLVKSLAFLKTLAALTAITVDDEIVALLEAIADSPALLDWLKGKIDADAAGVLSIETDPPQALVEEIGKRKIDWAKLIEKLPALIALVKALSGK